MAPNVNLKNPYKTRTGGCTCTVFVPYDCNNHCPFCVNKKDSWLLQTGIGLITLSVLKLFISDIWLLSSGLRILVLIGVSIIMLVVSFIYQQFKKKSDCVL